MLVSAGFWSSNKAPGTAAQGLRTDGGQVETHQGEGGQQCHPWGSVGSRQRLPHIEFMSGSGPPILIYAAKGGKCVDILCWDDAECEINGEQHKVIGRGRRL